MKVTRSFLSISKLDPGDVFRPHGHELVFIVIKLPPELDRPNMVPAISPRDGSFLFFPSEQAVDLLEAEMTWWHE